MDTCHHNVLDEKLLSSIGGNLDAMSSHELQALVWPQIAWLDSENAKSQPLLSDCVGYECMADPMLSSGRPSISVSSESRTCEEGHCNVPVESVVQSVAQDAEVDDAMASSNVGMTFSPPQELNQKGALRWADMLDCSDDDLPTLPSPCSATFGFADFQKEPDVFDDDDDVPTTLSTESQKTKVRKRRRTRPRLDSIEPNMFIESNNIAGSFAESDGSSSSLNGAEGILSVDHTARTTMFSKILTELHVLLDAFWIHAKDLSWRFHFAVAPSVGKLSRSPTPSKFRGRCKHSVNAAMTKRNGKANGFWQRIVSVALSARQHPILLIIACLCLAISFGQVFIGPGPESGRKYAPFAYFHSDVHQNGRNHAPFSHFHNDIHQSARKHASFAHSHTDVHQANRLCMQCSKFDPDRCYPIHCPTWQGSSVRGRR